MKKILILSILFSLPFSSFAGTHGEFDLSCTSKSLRTHLYMKLNDYDFLDEVLYPQLIVISVMGTVNIFDKEEKYGFGFKTINKNGLLDIYSTDKEKSYVFKVDFRKNKSAKVIIKKAINPRTQKVLSNLPLDCKKVHDL